MSIIGNAEARQTAITEMLKERDFVSVEELAARFDVTTQTIRRDINGLCEQGAARRRHGGVVPAALRGNATFHDRQVQNRHAKLAIAREVASHIPDGSSISFGIGTTPQLVAEALLTRQRMKIVTNNLPIALTIARNTSFEVAIAGGTVRTNDLDVCGGSEAFFAAYKVDVAVFGVGGVDEDGSLLDFTQDEVRARQTMLENCRRSFLVLDASKFGRAAHVHGGRIDQVTTVFCEADLPAPIGSLLSRSGTGFVRCPMTATRLGGDGKGQHVFP